MEEKLIELASSDGTQQLLNAATAYIWAEIILGVIVAIIFAIAFFKMFK